MRTLSLILGALLVGACFPLAAQQSLSEAKDGTCYLYGTIGRTFEAELTLTKTGKQFEGSYIYANHRQPIPPKGQAPSLTNTYSMKVGPTELWPATSG